MEKGKIPPQAVELEKAVLGAILLEKDAIVRVSNILIPESFYYSAHQDIYRAVYDLYTEGKDVDLLTVNEMLTKRHKIDKIGGAVYLSELTIPIASAANIEYHAGIVQQRYISRKVIEITSRINDKAFDESNDISDTINELVHEINSLHIDKRPGRMIKEIGRERILEIEKIATSDKKFTGITTGFASMDKFTGGWQPGNLIILAARPSMGKTRVAQEFIVGACKDEKTAVFFSLEMTEKEIFDRTLSAYTGIDTQQMRNGNLSSQEWQMIDMYLPHVEKLRFIVDDQAGLHIQEFRSKCNFYKMNNAIDLVVVDYMQLLNARSEKNRNMNREQEVAEISRTLKQIAKELNIPVIALAQLSRSVESRGGSKQPMLSDLRETGQIEQDADQVIFVYRPEYYQIVENEEGESTKNLIQLIIAKNRDGALAVLDLERNNNWSIVRERSKFEEPEPGEPDF